MISAVALSPQRRHICTPFQIHSDNIRTAEAVAFIKELRKRLRRPLIIIWDRWSVHRAAAKKILNSRLQKIEFEWLPAYAPELNPVEARWSHSKCADLANFVPDDTPQLKRAVRRSLKNHANRKRLKASFFKTAKLRI